MVWRGGVRERGLENGLEGEPMAHALAAADLAALELDAAGCRC